MAITAVEHAQFSPRNPTAGCSVSNRWIVAVAYNSSTSGTTPTDYVVFDTATETSAAFTFPLRNIGANSVVEYNGYAWAIGRNGTGTLFQIARINPATGGYTLFDVATGARGNVATIVYTGGWFHIAVLNTYDAPYDAWSYYRVNATTMIVSGFTGASYGGTRFLADSVGYGTTVWSLISAAGPVYRYKINMTTGVVTDVSGSSTFPGGGLVTGSTLYAGSGTWDLATETAIRSVPGSLNTPCLGPDGLAYSVNASQAKAVDLVNGASRTETFPTSRAERTRVYSAGGKLWTPSGYPL